MGRVPLEDVPALDRPLVQLLAAADDLDRAAGRAVVDRQRQPPVALLADHPVVHVAEPVELALVPEVGDPADAVDDLHDLVAQARVDLLRGERLARLVVDRAHRDEPLVDEAEEQRRAAAPAVRVAVRVRLEVVEEPAPLEVVDDPLGDVGGLEAAQPAEALVVAAVLVDRADDRQAERLAELVVLGAAAGGDVDDPGALLLGDLVPGDHAVLVRGRRLVAGALGERRLDRGQLVERARVAPPDELGAGLLLLDLEVADERPLEDAAAQPERLAVLADADVALLGVDGGGHVRGERPRRRRPDQERLAGPVDEREPDREPGVLAILVALVHLHLGEARSRSAGTTASSRGPCRASPAGGTRRGTPRSGRCSRC